MATNDGLEMVLAGLTFPEGPRWHDGRLWFSDFYTHRVIALTPEGWAETMAHVPQQPSGLGWRPDGTLLVVSMLDRTLMRVERGELSSVFVVGPDHVARLRWIKVGRRLNGTVEVLSGVNAGEVVLEDGSKGKDGVPVQEMTAVALPPQGT